MAEISNVIPFRLRKETNNVSNPVILWVDPGLTNGWAIYADCGFFSGECTTLQLGELISEYAEDLGSELWLGWEQYIVVRGGGRAGTPKYSLKAIGMMEWISYLHGFTVLPPVPSASRKLGDTPKLKRLGWYKSGAPHANDAASHLLAYLIRENRLPASLRKLTLTDL